MNLVDFVHGVVTGPSRRRSVWTVVGLVLFSAAVIALMIAGLRLDTWLGLGPLMPANLAAIVGMPVLVLGCLLVSWCLLVFISSRGTPVPFNPPRDLVARGPYRYTRNPMLTGLFISMVGAGLILRSVSVVFIVVPAVIVVAYVELKLVEEPELRRRLGDQYAEYARRVPMFLPRLPSRHGPLAK